MAAVVTQVNKVIYYFIYIYIIWQSGAMTVVGPSNTWLSVFVLKPSNGMAYDCILGSFVLCRIISLSLSLSLTPKPLPPFLNASSSPTLPPCTKSLSLSLSRGFCGLAMSEEGGGGGGGHGGVLWDNQSWAFSNSENSGGSEEKSGKKVQGSSSNSPVEMGEEEAAVPPSKKRGRGGVSKNGKGKEEGKGGGESDHEIHIWTERERRKKMRNMFANLHALLPQLPAKVKLIIIII
jgi:hypothetical protein